MTTGALPVPPSTTRPTHAAGRWGSCWPGSAACPHRSCRGRGGGRAGSACPAGQTGTPRTRCCCRCSPRLRAGGTRGTQGQWLLRPEVRGYGGQGKPLGAEEGHRGAGRPPIHPLNREDSVSCSPQLRGSVPPHPGSVGRQAPLTDVALQAEPLPWGGKARATWARHGGRSRPGIPDCPDSRSPVMGRRQHICWKKDKTSHRL